MDERDSFVIGWNFGRTEGRELSRREIGSQFPDVCSDSFSQGNIDGMRGDRWRLQRILKADQPASFRLIFGM